MRHLGDLVPSLRTVAGLTLAAFAFGGAAFGASAASGTPAGPAVPAVRSAVAPHPSATGPVSSTAPGVAERVAAARVRHTRRAQGRLHGRGKHVQARPKGHLRHAKGVRRHEKVPRHKRAVPTR